MGWPFIDVASLNYTATLRAISHIMLWTDGKTGAQKVKYYPKGGKEPGFKPRFLCFLNQSLSIPTAWARVSVYGTKLYMYMSVYMD